MGLRAVAGAGALGVVAAIAWRRSRWSRHYIRSGRFLDDVSGGAIAFPAETPRIRDIVEAARARGWVVQRHPTSTGRSVVAISREAHPVAEFTRPWPP